MNRLLSLGLAMLAGVAGGATAIKGLNAQTKPPTYVVIDSADITDPEGFKAVPASPAAGPARTAALGGRYLIGTEATSPVDGAPPKRLALIAFDRREKAQGWAEAAEVKEINAIRSKTTRSRASIVDGPAN
ncbi:MAG TPA: DUF1330 domain-containing protein [Xanthobacteraceae bacterium]|jgi:uncharacterized protein (DUF1330 family)